MCACVFVKPLRDDYDTEESPLTDEEERPLTQEELRQRILTGVSDAISHTVSHTLTLLKENKVMCWLLLLLLLPLPLLTVAFSNGCIFCRFYAGRAAITAVEDGK